MKLSYQKEAHGSERHKNHSSSAFLETNENGGIFTMKGKYQKKDNNNNN